MRLFLIRHGQTAWNTAGRAQGHTDEPLDECGLWQAQQLAQTFQKGTLDLVLTSDLQRSRMTAEVLADAAKAPIEVDPLLRERSFGELGGILTSMCANNWKQLQGLPDLHLIRSDPQAENQSRMCGTA